MKYLVKNAAITIEGNTILDNINFEVTDNNHIGIVGRNGAGKTTLLKALINNELFEEGVEDTILEIQKIGNFKIGYQEQITFENENITLIEEIEKSFSEIINLEKKIEKLLQKMTDNNSDSNINEYTESLEKYQYLGGYTYKREYEIMLNKFGFSDEDKKKLINSFSGGQKTKIAFIKLLLSKPDLLFLDEPTNHLDIETIIWLEDYLRNYKGAFIVVSHDRMFLNNIVNIIYDIEHGSTKKYVGNYEMFEKQKRENYAKALKDYEKQQKEIKRLREIYEKYRFKPTKASMALSRLHMIERMEFLKKPDKINIKTFKTNLDKIEQSAKMVLECKDLVVGYDNSLATINLEIMRGKKIGVIGANGTGKSTFLKTLQGLIKPLSGKVTYGYNVKIGYFDQNLAMIDSKNTVLEEFKLAYPNLTEQESRGALGAFLFRGEDVNKIVDTLSGGEKVRLSLCKLLYTKPNFLILDEPTNHLDIIGKQRLENILADYKGTIVFVSHDRYFVKKVATDLIIFEEDGAKYYPYNYEEYMDKFNNKCLEVKETKKVNTIKQNNSINNSYEIKKEIKKIEQEIIKLENKEKELNEKLGNPEIYNDYKKSASINEELKIMQGNINKLNIKWEELSNIMLNN